jgi:mRNA-degrading endonuclease RelE of RelBE toxin-antitoxin system
MSYKVFSIKPFDKQLKRLAKKYPSLKKEIARLFDELEENPQQGKSLGNNCYKIRISIASKGKGKSGGARVITFVQIVQSSVYLLSIYDKSEQEIITDKELSFLINEI